MKKYYSLFLALMCMLFIIPITACSNDDDDNGKKEEDDVTYEAVFTYGFEAVEDLPDACSEIRIISTDTDGKDSEQHLTAADSYKWTKTFTGSKFPSTAGFQVVLTAKDDSELTQESYTISYKTTHSFIIKDSDENSRTISTYSDTISVTTPKAKIADQIRRFNNRLTFIYTMEEDGSFEAVK